MTLRRRLLGVVGLGLLAVILACIAELAWFMHLVGMPSELPAHTDGIVAFTGGPERVETALRLLSRGRADRLLLSGIGGGAELAELAHRADVDPTPLGPRVTLGRNATTTRGNAMETAAWARANGIRSLLVVTAAYHMPRAITELERTLPEVALYPMPVSQERAGHSGMPLRLVAEEYIKFLATAAGLTAVLPVRDVPAAHPGHAG
jgi:uncharacterized SAM-binding protein YcdF (DUF218 family)